MLIIQDGGRGNESIFSSFSKCFLAFLMLTRVAADAIKTQKIIS